MKGLRMFDELPDGSLDRLLEDGRMLGESRGSVMTNDMWKDCNAMVGRVLSYLDEDEVRPSIKAAVKAELWAFHNKHNGDDNDDDRFNR